MHRRTLLGLAAATLTLPAAAQTLDRPVRIIVPFAPGGTSDILARLLAPTLTQSFGQNVVVENRTGAGGNIGADLVAKSAPDGHTLLLIDVSTLATAPSLYTRLPFDLKRDLAPVTMLIYAPYILAVHPSVPARNAAELVAYARANPQRMNIGHAGIGVGNHLTGLLVAQHWGADLTQVPYRGGAAALTAVAAGESQMIINGATATAPFCRQGTLRAIAVTGPARLPDFPDVPTFAELGWPAAQSGTWQGVLAQGGTPPAMVNRLAADIRAAMAVPATAERITALGAVNKAEGPDSFRTWLDAEIEVWARVVRANAIRLD
jgi:tripartite-type tricarboxylate transporter receptor subunit TctC